MHSIVDCYSRKPGYGETSWSRWGIWTTTSSDFVVARAFLDESHAGALLATINQLWADKEHLLQRNQVLQAAAATQTQDELAKAQAATIAAEDRAADAVQQLNTASERIAHLTALNLRARTSFSIHSLRLKRTWPCNRDWLRPKAKYGSCKLGSPL